MGSAKYAHGQQILPAKRNDCFVLNVDTTKAFRSFTKKIFSEKNRGNESLSSDYTILPKR